MYSVVKKYCENERNNGLYLLDMPTGSGKTHSVIKYIFDASMDEANKGRRYFFITTQKKNLPTEELEKLFKNAGKKDLFKEKFLFIDSNADCVITTLTDSVKSSIPDDIKKTDEYKKFEKAVSFLQNQDSNRKLQAFASTVKDTLRMEIEPAFRKHMQDLLAKAYPTVEKRILAVKTDKRWQWLGELYPAVFTKDKQIIFLSIDKILSRNATIVESSYMFYDSEIIRNAIIFIDEFDATKETMLNNIIQNGLRDKIDYVDLFLSIYNPLQTSSFPSTLTIPSQKRKEGEYAEQSLQSVIDRIKEKAKIIYDTYSLQFSHRTTSEESSSRNFLFQDHQFHSILDGNKKFVVTKSLKKDQINAIQFTEEKPKEDANNIQVLLGKLRGFITWFLGGVYILAINYMQRKQEERKEGDDEFTIEFAIRSVLSLFRLNQTYVDFLTSQILITNRKNKGDIQGADFDNSFYENGFRFYAFENDLEHDMQSKMMMCSFQNTPEKILLRFCEKAKVIGISATATIDTVIGNFDLSYLKAKMQAAYQEISNEDYLRLKKEFEDSQRGYEKVKINTELLGDLDYNNYGITSWMRVFDSHEVAEQAFNIVYRKCSENRNNYIAERYLRISEAYMHFLRHSDIQSFLCVLTKHPRPNDPALDLNVIYELFKLISSVYQPELSVQNTVVLLDGDDFDQKKNDVTLRLAKGEKLFVISVYQTIGAGQNLQYKAPKSLQDSLVKINDRESGEKDYDAIYLDRPTNLFVYFNPGQPVEEDQFVKALFQNEFLQENAELSVDDAITNIKNTFKALMSNGNAKGDYTTNIRDCKSIRMLATRFIIQAIGRICRTSLKQHNIYIFADSRIAESIDLSVSDRRILNREFSALLEKVRESNYKSPEISSLEAKAALKSIRVNKYTRNMLKEEWNDPQIDRWKKLRELVIKHPTMSKEEVAKNFVACNYYIELPAPANRVYFKQEEDFNKITVSFTRNVNYNKSVSAEGSKLTQLMEIPYLYSFFKDSGFATEFKENDYIMSPPLWNNIYKGALGEVVGKYLFKKVLNLDLEDITDPATFELFDYKVKNTSIYVDFKNWHEYYNPNDPNYCEKLIAKIVNKADKCRCRCAIIANIIASRDNYRVREIIRDGVHIVLVPALLLDTSKKEYLEAWEKIKENIDKYGN